MPLLVVLSCLGAAPTVARAEEEGLARFDGTFLYAGSKQEQARRLESVEAVASKMNVLLRGLASRRLRQVTEPAPRLVFVASGSTLSLSRRGRIPAKIALGGPPVRYTNRWGERAKARRRWVEGALIELIGDGASGQTNTFRLRDDGEVLTMGGRITSPRLPADVVFTHTYRRSGS